MPPPGCAVRWRRQRCGLTEYGVLGSSGGAQSLGRPDAARKPYPSALMTPASHHPNQLPGATTKAATATSPSNLMGSVWTPSVSLPTTRQDNPVALRVGLTGGIASGKSEVSARLAAHGAVVIDADLLAREVVEPGTAGWTEVVLAFGPDVVRDDERLDRETLGSRVFADPSARQRLETIIHPRVRARAAALEAQAPPDAVVVHDIPLLVESGQADRFDVVVVVDCPPHVQIERLLHNRGMTQQQAAARIDAQTDPDERRAVADYLIDNTGPLEMLDEQVDEVWRQLTARLPGQPTGRDEPLEG